MEPRLPLVCFRSNDVPVADVFDIIRDGSAPYCSVLQISPEADISVIDCLVGDLIVSRLTFEALDYDRNRRHIDANGASVLVQVQLKGNSRYAAGESRLGSGAGNVVVQDTSVPARVTSFESDVLSILIPRECIDHAAGLWKRGPLLSLPCGSRPGSSIRTAALRLWTAIQTLSASSARERADDFVARFNAAMASRTSLNQGEKSRQKNMFRFVQENLDDLDLGVATLQSAFDSSRATVYRAFAEVDGVACYIRRLRLEQCYQELTDPRRPAGMVNAIACKWGFENASHFNRLIRQSFGTTPSALAAEADLGSRRVGPVAEAAAPGPATFREFLAIQHSP